MCWIGTCGSIDTLLTPTPRMIMYEKMCLLLALVIFSQSAAAQWSGIDTVDDFTDEDIKMVVYDDENIRLQFNVEETYIMGNKVEAMFIYLSTKKLAQTFEPQTEVDYRIDKNKAGIMQPMTLEGLQEFYTWSPRTIRVLWARADLARGCSELGELMTGKKFKGRFHISSTQRDSFNISLDGAKEAFIKVFGEEYNLEKCVEY